VLSSSSEAGSVGGGASKERTGGQGVQVVPRYAEDRGSFSIRLGLGQAADIQWNAWQIWKALEQTTLPTDPQSGLV
jgi:hypothetical protein